jgi:two-component system response regulator FixJ
MNRNEIVYVVDDDQAVRESMQLLLESAGVTARAYASAEAFLAEFEPRLLSGPAAGWAAGRGAGDPVDAPGMKDPERARCLLLDVRMAPGMSGLELQRLLIEAKIELPIVFLTANADVPMAVDAVRRGACEFLEKPIDSARLLDCVRQALERDGRCAATRKMRGEVLSRYASLTPREVQVLEQVAAGRANKVTAAALHIGEKTVETHRLRLMRKMGAESIPDLIRMLHAIGKFAE